MWINDQEGLLLLRVVFLTHEMHDMDETIETHCQTPLELEFIAGMGSLFYGYLHKSLG